MYSAKLEFCQIYSRISRFNTELTDSVSIMVKQPLPLVFHPSQYYYWPRNKPLYSQHSTGPLWHSFAAAYEESLIPTVEMTPTINYGETFTYVWHYSRHVTYIVLIPNKVDTIPVLYIGEIQSQPASKSRTYHSHTSFSNSKPYALQCKNTWPLTLYFPSASWNTLFFIFPRTFTHFCCLLV